MQQEHIDRIAVIVEEVLTKGGFVDCAIEIDRSDKRSIAYTVRTHSDNSRFLIGQYGDNLHALQHIVHLAVRKEFGNGESFPFVIDVNDYRKQKDRSIADLARSAARDAKKDNRSVLLRPMTAYERRIVHTALADDSSVVTESIGSGQERKVMVRALDMVESYKKFT